MNGRKEVAFLKLTRSACPRPFPSLIALDAVHLEAVMFSYCISLSPAKPFPSLTSSIFL